MILNENIDWFVHTIATAERLKECYELRLHLLRNGYAHKSQYEKNEMDILEFETKRNIGLVADRIRSKEDEFELLFANYIHELDNENSGLHSSIE